MHTSGSTARYMLWSCLLAPHVTSAVLSCREATERCEMHERSRTVRGSHSPRQCGLLTDARTMDVHDAGKASWRVRSDKWSWEWKACTRPSVPRSAPMAVDTDDRLIMSSIERARGATASHGVQAAWYCDFCSVQQQQQQLTAASSARQTAAWPC